MNMLAFLETSKPTKKKLSVEDARDLTGSNLLWRSVLSQAVKDIYGTDTGDRLETIRWLKTKDFETVCDFAHVEHTSMREQLIALVALPLPLAKKYGKQLSDLIMSGVHHSD